ncbi:hypothetical protein NFI96_033261, partial [Prochilodus magdalenae]
APTTPTVRSEFFKPCQDSQELAFCLNEGECFIIETVAGVHRHCSDSNTGCLQYKAHSLWCSETILVSYCKLTVICFRKDFSERHIISRITHLVLVDRNAALNSTCALNLRHGNMVEQNPLGKRFEEPLFVSQLNVRCKEGYRGLRCDQFVPKTDSILSDPTADELGIEFMESGETYQRQILSIFSIAMGIGLLGLACMALYCRNKRQKEKHRAHLTEIRNLRDCNVNALRLMSKSSSRTECGLQHQKCCKAHGSSPTSGRGTVHSSSKFSAANQSRSLSMGKRRRSCSFSSSPALKQKISNHRSTVRWTPPISRAGHHLIGGSRDSIHSYKHLQEVESTDVMSESLRRCQSHTDGNQHRSSYLNMQTVASAPRGRLAYTDVPCTRLDQGTAFPRPSYRACSVPIIPSVQGSDQGDRSVGGGSAVLLYKSGVSASHALINPETEAEALSLANSSQSLAGLAAAKGSHGLTCSESALVVGQTKHKSLVTYTTALGAGTDSSRAKTVISTAVLALSSLSKSTGKLERRPVRSARGGSLREDHGAGLQTSFFKGEKDFHLSGELRGVSCLTPPKS